MITYPKGFKASGIFCGIKKKGLDLALIYSEGKTNACGVWTKNKLKSAPILLSMKNIKNKIQAIIVNSGNANCAVKDGIKKAQEMAKITAKELKISKKQVLVASTGVIGKSLPIEKIKNGINKLVKSLSYEGGNDAAKAILTTDKKQKQAQLEINLDNKKVRIGAMAKGSGMINPDLATMLVFITTDINIKRGLLQKALKNSVDKSFNTITIDGDTSPNDCVIIIANGYAKNKLIYKEDKNFIKFQNALNNICLYLAKEIVKNGEGATKFIEIEVKGAKNFLQAKKIAKNIANSNLVKTALFGWNPNWGRVINAVGYADVDLDIQKVDIYFSDIKLVSNGFATRFDEKKLKKLLKNKEIKIIVDLKDGNNKAKVWTSDLSYEYVKINSEYLT